MSILANLEIIDKILIIFILLVLLKMIFDVNRFMKKRKEYLKLKENEQLKYPKENESETELENSDERSNENG